MADSAGAPSITCPKCHMTSHNPNDVREGYCGSCHEYLPVVMPVNVRIRYMDGSEDPVELVYVGRDDRGIDRWEAVPTAPLVSRLCEVRVDEMPARSSIQLRFT